MKWVFLGVIIATLLQPSAYSCGSWTFEDLEAHSTLTFKATGVELQDAKRKDPEFMSSNFKAAYFANGDRIFFKSGKIVASLYKGMSPAGKRSYEVRELGSSTVDSLVIKDFGNFHLEESKGTLFLKQDDHTIGKAKLRRICFDLKKEKRRILAYVVWKSRRIDPFAQPVDHWWW